MRRSKKAALNTVFLAAQGVTVAICGFILPRLILTNFGSEYNGLIASVFRFLSLITLLQLGVDGVTRVALYKPLASNDMQTVSGILNATQRYMRKIVIIFVGYSVMLAVVYPIISNSSLPALEVSLLVGIMAIATFAECCFGMTYKILLAADQRQYVYIFLQLVGNLLYTGFAYIIIKSGGNVLMVKLSSTIIFSLRPIILYFYVSKKYKIDKTVAPITGTLTQRWDAAAHQLCKWVQENTDIMILTVMTNPVTVSIYTVYALTVNNIKKLILMVIAEPDSAFGNMMARDETQAIRKNFAIFELFMNTAVSVVSVCSVVLLLPFIRLYTTGIKDDASIYVNAWLFGLLSVVAMALYCLRIPYYTIISAAGHFKQTKKYAIADVAINLIISAALTLKLGLVGVIIGTIVSNIYRLVADMNYMSKNLLKLNFGSVILRYIWLAVTSAVSYCLIRVVLPNSSGIESWLEWLLTALICLFICGGVTLTADYLCYKSATMDAFRLAKRMFFRK